MCNKVLIIDDSIPLHKLISTYLAPDNVKMHSAYDGESGLVAAARLLPSLILLDVDMPRIDGFEVCRRLKADPITAAIPVVFLSARSMLDNRVKGLDIGAADYISKPFKPAELRARVRASLRAKNQIEAVNLVDAATGLWNRAYMNAHLDYHVSLAKRFGVALSCMVVEVDHGESLAEKFGEAAAADLFRAVGRILSSGSRAEDVVCRFDAWKFGILVSSANGAAAALVAERLRREVQRQLRARKGRATHVTCSFGVADTIHGDSATLIDRADAALCGARLAGCNCVFLARGACDVVNAVA